MSCLRRQRQTAKQKTCYYKLTNSLPTTYDSMSAKIFPI
jgi:hypothetical protein